MDHGGDKVGVSVTENETATTCGDGSDGNGRNSNCVEVGGGDMKPPSADAHSMKHAESVFPASAERPQKPLFYTLGTSLPQQEREEEKLKQGSVSPHVGSGPIPPSEYSRQYRQMLFRRAEELIQVGTRFERYPEEAKRYFGRLRQNLEPRAVDLISPPDIHIGSRRPSVSLIRVCLSFNEEEVESASQALDVRSVETRLLSTRKGSTAPDADSTLYKRPPDFCRELIMSRVEELEKANKEFERYTTEIAKQFKKPPVVLPDHLQNCFTGENVIVAKEHKGCMDVSGHSPYESNEPSCHDREVCDAPVSPHTQLDNSGGGETSWQIPREQQDQLTYDDSEVEPLPRFTIVSLSNGDLREYDACAGQAYWDAGEPVDVRRVVPSQLLDERIVEAYHNYRYYSHRWRALLVDLALALGGEDGAELMRRYEQREESLPLSPRCQRAFYESVVNYGELLQQQEIIIEAVERDLEEYRARILDGPVAYQ